MRTITVACQKGGVGKSTTVVHLARAFAQLGRRVLLVDLDAQGNATAHLCSAEPALTVQEVLVPGSRRKDAVAEGSIASAIMPADDSWGSVWVAPSDGDLSLPTSGGVSDFYRLSTALAGVADYDVVIIDTPPDAGMEAMNALLASDEVLIVAEPAYGASGGVSDTVETVAQTVRGLNPRLHVLGVLINDVSGHRLRDQRSWIEHLRSTYGDLVLTQTISRAEVIPQSFTAGLPLDAMGRDGLRLSEQYATLAREIESRGQRHE